jgi:hypothetical protein
MKPNPQRNFGLALSGIEEETADELSRSTMVLA